MDKFLKLAEAIATVAHDGQVDKCGYPYINHPKTVSENCTTMEGKIVGWLHDVVEDTSITFDTLTNLGFGNEIIEALRCVTKEEGYIDDEYYERIKSNPIAREVKLADLRHNADLSRIPQNASDEFKAKMLRKRDKYLSWIEYLSY